jgi:hypothetical protein
MSKPILITINNSGNDPGPYDLTLIDGSGNETPWSGNPVTKAQLIAGYQMIVPDAIVKVKVKSKTCTTYVQLTIPTTLCPCRSFDFVNGHYIFYECGRTTPTNLIITTPSLRYCVDTNQPVVKVSGAGNFTETSICCTYAPPQPTPTTTTTTSTTTTSSTTTSSTTTSTTTTTTTANPCNCITFTNIGDNDQEARYIDCNGVTQFIVVPGNTVVSYCGCCGVSFNPTFLFVSQGGTCINGVCP